MNFLKPWTSYYPHSFGIDTLYDCHAVILYWNHGGKYWIRRIYNSKIDLPECSPRYFDLIKQVKLRTEEDLKRVGWIIVPDRLMVMK